MFIWRETHRFPLPAGSKLCLARTFLVVTSPIFDITAYALPVADGAPEPVSPGPLPPPVRTFYYDHVDSAPILDLSRGEDAVRVGMLSITHTSSIRLREIVPIPFIKWLDTWVSGVVRSQCDPSVFVRDPTQLTVVTHGAAWGPGRMDHVLVDIPRQADGEFVEDVLASDCLWVVTSLGRVWRVTRREGAFDVTLVVQFVGERHMRFFQRHGSIGVVGHSADGIIQAWVFEKGVFEHDMTFPVAVRPPGEFPLHSANENRVAVADGAEVCVYECVRVDGGKRAGLV